MKKIVDDGIVTGLLVYYNKETIGWCSVAPRDDFLVLENSRVLKKVDEQKVWSIVCFYMKSSHRKKGLTPEILKEVVKYVKKKRGKIIEGYPVEPKINNMPSVFAWTGFASAFRKAGFEEVARRSETRPIMRYYL